MGKKVKNKDLAARLGVSSTLVSLVLNNKADQHGIRKDTQERVLSMARQMGYFESAKFRGESMPIEEKPGVIGMIVPDLNDSFIYEILPYFNKAFASIGVGFSVITKDPDDQRYSRLVGAFKKFFSGIILVGDTADDYTLRTLKTGNYPFVLLEKSVKKQRLNTVLCDNRAGVKLVTDHIRKLGYKNILILSASQGSKNDQELVSNLKETIKANGNFNKPMFLDMTLPPMGEKLDMTEMERFLRPPASVEVMIIVNAELVSPVMMALMARKIRIPLDIALISMEEGMGFDLMYSPVTTLRKPLASMAIKVSNMIWSEIKNEGKGKYKRQVSLNPELVVRNSCGTIS